MIRLFIKAMPVIVAGLFAAFIVEVGGRHPPKKVIKGVREFAGMLSAKKAGQGFIDRINSFLIKNGARFHYGKSASPATMIIASAILFAVGWILGMRMQLALSVLFAFIGAAGPWLLLPALNKSDNEKMLQDIKMIYHALAMQIKAGVYVADAISEMYSGVKFTRLREALLDLGGDMVMKSDMFGALERFQSKFDNRYIDSLCITILQSMESGQAVELLSDIADQVKDMEKAVLEKRKGRLDRSLTFYQLGMLACVLAVALYACVNYMLMAAVNI